MAEKRILVAEDDPVFRRVIVFALERMGFEVKAVGDGQIAQQELDTGAYDLLVTDHQMPLCNGIELIDQLRSESMYIDLPIVLCTARGLELDKEGLRSKYRLAEIMHKPFSPRLLAERIRNLLTSDAAAC